MARDHDELAIDRHDVDELDSETGTTYFHHSAGLIIAVVLVLYIAAFVLLVPSMSYDQWGGVVLGGVFFALVAPLLVFLARKDPDPRIAQILVAAYAAKQVGTYIRYYVVTQITGGDALVYHEVAELIAPAVGARDFGDPDFQQWAGELKGTNVLRIITAVVYNIFGTSRLGGFMVFALLAFLGTYLVYRAFVIAMPTGRTRLFALLLFFLPSLLFWPSSIGKDSWLLFAVGLTVNGAARLYARRPGALPLIALGLATSAIVRPHVTILLVSPLILAKLIGRSGRHDRGRVRGVLSMVFTIAFFAVAVLFTAQRAGTFLDNIGDGSVSAALEETSRRSTQGNSAFTPVSVTSPAGVPAALVTVIFRPFPHEAHNLAARATALESVVLMGFTLMSLRGLLRLPTLIRGTPLVAYASIYVLMFVVAFSAVGNFGILVRQRTQLYPLLLILLIASRRSKRRDRSRRATPSTELDEAVRL